MVNSTAHTVEMSLVFIFKKLPFEMGISSKQLVHNLRAHFSDVCSDGDVVVNRIIDALEKGTYDTDKIRQEHGWLANSCEGVIKGTLLHWKSAGECVIDAWHMC